MDVTSVAAAVPLSSSSIVLLPVSEERWPLHCSEVQKHFVTSVHLHMCGRREGVKRKIWYYFIPPLMSFFFFLRKKSQLLWFIALHGHRENKIICIPSKDSFPLETMHFFFCVAYGYGKSDVRTSPWCIYVNYKKGSEWCSLVWNISKCIHPSEWMCLRTIPHWISCAGECMGDAMKWEAQLSIELIRRVITLQQ